MAEQADTAAQGKAKIGNHRWIVVGLLFTAIVINNVDRQMMLRGSSRSAAAGAKRKRMTLFLLNEAGPIVWRMDEWAWAG
jgi:uncharacterized protein YaaW (UPF0174 family)